MFIRICQVLFFTHFAKSAADDILLHSLSHFIDVLHILCYRGVVAVTMRLLELDINQCPDTYYVPNAFKDTHKCDKKTSYVSIVISASSFLIMQLCLRNKMVSMMFQHGSVTSSHQNSSCAWSKNRCIEF